MRRSWQVLLLSALLVLASLWLVLPDAFGPETLQVLRRVDPRLFIASAAMMPLWWLVASLRILLLSRQLGTRIGLGRGIQIHVAGVFSASVTPAGSGNSIGMILLMTRSGVRLDAAISISILLLVGEMLFFAWATPVAFMYLLLQGFNLPFRYLGLIVALLSLLATVSGLLLTFRLRYAVWLLRRLFTLAPLRRFYKRVDTFLTEVQHASERLARADLGFYLAFFTLSSLYRIPFFFVLYLVLLALHAEIEPAIVLAVQTIIHPFSIFVPTPGASGFQEVTLSLALREHLTEWVITGALITWRLVTFYLHLLIAPVLCGPALLDLKPGSDAVS